MKQTLQLLIDIIYPKRCLLCGNIISFGDKGPICEDCMKNVAYADPSLQTDRGFSLFEYKGEIRKAIFHLKYDGNKALGKSFATLLYEAFIKNKMPIDFDEIVPVPISEKRLKERGYNQTELIARELSALTKIPYSSGLIRIKETAPQNDLGISERAENVKDAFDTKGSFEGKRILLIDDIFTTGSTINECTRMLLKAGAADVKYCTVAKAMLRNMPHLSNRL